ncbi:MAG: hypothetical protein KA236_15195, partial [Verrucomicrobia bacterium]|nr:hypothetical protein [Verrucomicrobiota bacterium]
MAAITIVAYFIAFTALCWFLDLTHTQLGKMNHQDRYWLFLKSGAITGLFALLASRMLLRSHRRLAAIGLLMSKLFRNVPLRTREIMSPGSVVVLGASGGGRREAGAERRPTR